MNGILRVQIAPKLPRERLGGPETIDGARFEVSQVRLRRPDSLPDRLLLHRSLHALAGCGVTQLAAPALPYIKRLFSRYNMTEISHTPLLRGLAPQIIDHLLRRRTDAAVTIYAQRLDESVLAAVHHASRYYQTVMLDLGRWSEPVQEQMLDLYGISALIGVVPARARACAALWFDCPPPPLCRRMDRMISVALCGPEAPADYNDIRLRGMPESVPPDTDREGILSAIVSENAMRATALEIDCLVKI